MNDDSVSETYSVSLTSDSFIGEKGKRSFQGESKAGVSERCLSAAFISEYLNVMAHFIRRQYFPAALAVPQPAGGQRAPIV